MRLVIIVNNYLFSKQIIFPTLLFFNQWICISIIHQVIHNNPLKNIRVVHDGSSMLHQNWPLGVRPSPSPFSSHLQNLNVPPPPSISHLHPAAHTNWKLCGLCIFMATCRGTFHHFSSSLFSLLLKPRCGFFLLTRSLIIHRA
jgi:hypothetical protein